MVPSMQRAIRQRMRVRFLPYKKIYLLLAKGMIKIESKEPNIAPIVRIPIRNPFAIGFSI
jgi:hypothetical protein